MAVSCFSILCVVSVSKGYAGVKLYIKHIPQASPVYLFAFIFFVPPLTAASPPDRITEVKTNIYVTSFGPVSDTDMVRADPTSAFISPTPVSQTQQRSPPLRTRTPGSSPFSCTYNQKASLCFIFSFTAAFPLSHNCIISPGRSTRAGEPEVGRVFHPAAQCLFI